MERQVYRQAKLMWMLKALLVSYIVSAFLLMGLTMLLYKLELNESIVSAGIIAIYFTSTFLGGIVIGKLVRVRRFLWGLLLGILYFALLLLITLGVYRTLHGDSMNLMTTLILCAGGGMAGGMIS